MTCPYCGTDAADGAFIAKADIDHARETVAVATTNDVADALADMFEDAFRPLSRSSGGPFSIKVEFKRGSRRPLPVARREDLLREARCPICQRRYAVYAIGLFCPDCGAVNLSAHFTREIELAREHVAIARTALDEGKDELAFRLLGDVHENVVTAFETHLKHVHAFIVRRRFPAEAERRCSKKVVGNAFQNIRRSRELFQPLGIDPFSQLPDSDLRWFADNVEKRHVLGHNLGLVDKAYADAVGAEHPGRTVRLLADEVLRFADLASTIVAGLERLPEFNPTLAAAAPSPTSPVLDETEMLPSSHAPAPRDP